MLNSAQRMKRTVVKLAAKKKRTDKILNFLKCTKIKHFVTKIIDRNLNDNNNFNKIKSAKKTDEDSTNEEKEQSSSLDSKKLQKIEKIHLSNNAPMNQKTKNNKSLSTEKEEEDVNLEERSLTNRFLKQVKARTGFKADTGFSESKGVTDSCLSQSLELSVLGFSEQQSSFSCKNHHDNMSRQQEKKNHNNSSMKDALTPKRFSSEEERSTMDILSVVDKEEVLRYVKNFKKLQALNKSNHQSSYLTSETLSDGASADLKSYRNTSTPHEVLSTSQITTLSFNITDLSESSAKNSTYGGKYDEVLEKVVSTRNALVNLQKRLSSAKKSTKSRKTSRSSKTSRKKSSPFCSSSKNDYCYIPISSYLPSLDPYCTTTCMEACCTTSCMDGCCTTPCLDGCCITPCMDGYPTSSCVEKYRCNDGSSCQGERSCRNKSDDYDSIDSSSIVTLSISNSSLASSIVTKMYSKGLSSASIKLQKLSETDAKLKRGPKSTVTYKSTTESNIQYRKHKKNATKSTSATESKLRKDPKTITGSNTQKTSVETSSQHSNVSPARAAAAKAPSPLDEDDDGDDDGNNEGDDDEDDVNVQVLTSPTTCPLPLSPKARLSPKNPLFQNLLATHAMYDDRTKNVFSTLPFHVPLSHISPKLVKNRTDMTSRLPFPDLSNTDQMNAEDLKHLKATINGYLNFQIKELSKKGQKTCTNLPTKKVRKSFLKKSQKVNINFSETVNSSKPFPELSSSATRTPTKQKKRIVSCPKLESTTPSTSYSAKNQHGNENLYNDSCEFNSFEEPSNKDTCNNNENASYPMVDSFQSPHTNTSYMNTPQQVFSGQSSTNPSYPLPCQPPLRKLTPQLNVTVPRGCLPPCSVACGPEPMCCPENAIFYEESPFHPYQRTLERMNQLRKTFKEQKSDDCMSNQFSMPQKKSSSKDKKSKKNSKKKSVKADTLSSKSKSTHLKQKSSQSSLKTHSEKSDFKSAPSTKDAKSTKSGKSPKSEKSGVKGQHAKEKQHHRISKKISIKPETPASKGKPAHNKMKSSQSSPKVHSVHSDVKSVPSTKDGKSTKSGKSYKSQKSAKSKIKSQHSKPNAYHVANEKDREFFGKMLDVFDKMLSKTDAQRSEKFLHSKKGSSEKTERLLGILGKTKMFDNDQFAYPTNFANHQAAEEAPHMRFQVPNLTEPQTSNHQIHSETRKLSVMKTDSFVKKQESLQDKFLLSKLYPSPSARPNEDVSHQTSLWKRFLCTEFCKPYKKGVFHKQAQNLPPSDSSQTSVRQKFKVDKLACVSNNARDFDEPKFLKDSVKKTKKKTKSNCLKIFTESNSCEKSSKIKEKNEFYSYDQNKAKKIARQIRKESKKKQKHNSKMKKKLSRKKEKAIKPKTLFTESQTIATSQKEDASETKSSDYSRGEASLKKRRRHLHAKLKAARQKLEDKSYASDISAQTSFCLMKALNVQKNFKKEMKKTEALLKKVMLKKGMYFKNLSKNSSEETITKSQKKNESSHEQKRKNDVPDDLTQELTMKVDALIQSRLNDELKNLQNKKELQSSSNPLTSDIFYSLLNADNTFTLNDQKPLSTVYRELNPSIFPNVNFDPCKMPPKFQAVLDPISQPVEAATQTEKEKKSVKTCNKKIKNFLFEKKIPIKEVKKSSKIKNIKSKEAKKESDNDSLEKNNSLLNKESSEILITIKNKNLSKKKNKHEKLLEGLIDSLRRKNKQKRSINMSKSFENSRISLYSLYEHKKRLEEEMLNVDLSLRRLHTAPYNHPLKSSSSRRCVSAFDDVTDSYMDRNPYEYRNQSTNNILLELMDDAEVIVLDDVDEVPNKRCEGVSLYNSNQVPRKGYNGTIGSRYNNSLKNRYGDSLRNMSKNSFTRSHLRGERECSLRKGASLKRGAHDGFNKKRSIIAGKSRPSARKSFAMS